MIISADDRRGPRALALALRSNTWTRRGSSFFVPSLTAPGRSYVAARDFCSCPAFRYRGHERVCFHALAVALIDELADERAAF